MQYIDPKTGPSVEVDFEQLVYDQDRFEYADPRNIKNDKKGIELRNA